MAEPAPTSAPEGDPPFDPASVDRAYLVERARRRARIEHQRAKRRARLRFWLVFCLLLGVTIFLMLTVWSEVEKLFGL